MYFSALTVAVVPHAVSATKSAVKNETSLIFERLFILKSFLFAVLSYFSQKFAKYTVYTFQKIQYNGNVRVCDFRSVQLQSKGEIHLEIYLDNSATTVVCPEAAEAAMLAMTDNYGNPSALHSNGVRAKQLLETSRQQVADALCVLPEEVYFAHSGTLANNTAILAAVNMRRRRGNRIITSSVEHPSVARVIDELERNGYDVVRLKPRLDGAVAHEDIVNAINDKTILVSLMYVNNETGAINPVEGIRKAVKAAHSVAMIHVDAIQAFGKMPVKPHKIGADFLTISGHKVHAPKGVGALYVRKGLIPPCYVFGGGQENGLFSGTENMPAIAGFGAAAAALPDPSASLRQMKKLRTRLLTKLSEVPTILINSPENGLPNIINMSVLGTPSQVLVNFFSERGICVSAGSACKKGHRSEVLTQLDFTPIRIDSAIRVSMSRYTTEEDIDRFAEAAVQAADMLRVKEF